MYTPDRWVMLRIATDKETLYKILAGWSGSYTYGESWKINSGCVSASINGNYYKFKGYSGSIYKCHKNAYGLTVLTAGILNDYKSVIKQASIEVLPEEADFVRYINELNKGD